MGRGAANLLQRAGIRSAFLGGELHVHRSDGQRPRVHDVTRIARNPASEAEVDSLCFAVFDVYSFDDEDFIQSPPWGDGPGPTPLWRWWPHPTGALRTG